VDVTQARRLFFLALIASLSATAGLAIFFLLFADFDETTERIILTTALISLFSLFALPAGVLLDQRRFTALAWIVLALSTVAFGLAMVLTWGSWEDDGDESVWKTLASVAAFAAASSQAAMTTSRRRPEDGEAVRLLYLASLACAALLALMIAAAAWAEVDDESYYRALGALAIADLFLVVVQSVARRLGGAPAAARTPHQVVFTLDRPASDEAVSAASRALERAGARVERVDRRG
jgi:hypothetical protein